MTEKELRDHVIDIALSYYGVQEGSIQHKQIVNAYNAVKPLPPNITAILRFILYLTFSPALLNALSRSCIRINIPILTYIREISNQKSAKIRGSLLASP